MRQRKPFKAWAVVQTDAEGLVKAIFAELHLSPKAAEEFKREITPSCSSLAKSVAPVTVRIDQKKLRELRKVAHQ